MIDDVTKEKIRRMTNLIALVFVVSPLDLSKKIRTSTIARARQALMYLLRSELKLSYPKIGEALKRDHSTVMDDCRKIIKLITVDHDKTLKNMMIEVRDRYNAGE